MIIQGFKPCGDDDDSVVEHLQDVLPGVDSTPEDDDELPGLDTDIDAKPTGVEADIVYASQDYTGVDSLRQQDQEAALTKAPRAEPSAQPSTEPIVETQDASPKKRMAARNARNRKQPEK